LQNILRFMESGVNESGKSRGSPRQNAGAAHRVRFPKSDLMNERSKPGGKGIAHNERTKSDIFDPRVAE